MSILVALVLLLYSFFAIGTGSASSGSGSAHAQAFLEKGAVTRTDNGHVVDIRTSSDVTLQLPHHWSAPRLAGSSVRLEQIDFTVDPGFDAWRVAPVRKGATTIRATGPRGSPFRVTIRVG
jgi:hypothetical protein